MTRPDSVARVVRKTTGSLVGLALGDALGAPVENWERGEIASVYPEGVRDFVDRSTGGSCRGKVTDDTEMAFLLARSLLARECLDLLDITTRLISWVDGGGAAGPSTSRAVVALRQGVAPYRSGSQDAPSTGCLPRCAPVGLAMPVYCVVDSTSACCELTHRHPRAVIASITLNLLLTHLVDGEEWTKAVETVKAQTEGRLLSVDVREQQHESAADSILAEAVARVSEASNAEEAIVSAVSTGGDTDTRGAVAGALAGARWGLEALPEHWMRTCDATKVACQIGCSIGEFRFRQRRR